MDSIRGQLLIAGPALADPNFWRTVVLIVEHSEDGALGLVLNRPTETAVGEVLPQLSELIEPPVGLLVGGPVQQSSVIVLAAFENPDDAALIAFDDVGILGNVDEDDGAGHGIRAARAFAGHAGWAPGQLDGSSSAETGSSSPPGSTMRSRRLPPSCGRTFWFARAAAMR